MEHGTHGHRVPLSRRSVWIAKAGTIVGLIVFVALVRALTPALLGAQGRASGEIGVLLALVPAALWLILFYVQDSQEPEPLTYVVQAAIAGGIVAGALALPVLRQVYDTAAWLYASPLATLLGAICVIGGVQQFCTYLAVRYTVFENDEFDEVGDGVTYGMAAGLGLATAFNIWFVLESAGLNPAAAAVRIAVTALAQAAFGGIIGYALGQAKVHGRDGAVLWGFLAAAVLNGLFIYLLGAVTISGLSYHPWNGVVLAAAMAVIVTLVLFRSVRVRTPSTIAS
jgi:RsiW-degrading membrane proteinase PrsW (M82 family)